MEPIVKCVVAYNGEELTSTMERREIAAFIDRFFDEAWQAKLVLVHAEAEFRFVLTNPETNEKASLSVKVPARFLEAGAFVEHLRRMS